MILNYTGFEGLTKEKDPRTGLMMSTANAVRKAPGAKGKCRIDLFDYPIIFSINTLVALALMLSEDESTQFQSRCAAFAACYKIATKRTLRATKSFRQLK
jgi:hypothetical protein